MSFCDTLSDEDRRIWDEAEATEQANREANRALMDAHNVPRAARKGFYVASLYGLNKIVKIIEYPRDDRASRWGVFTELYAGSYTRNVYVVGPRGAAKKVV
jgi:hypothetical protein